MRRLGRNPQSMRPLENERGGPKAAPLVVLLNPERSRASMR